MRLPLPQQVMKSSVSDGYDLRYYKDSPDDRIVTANVVTIFGSEDLKLWEGDAYDAIGQWTDDQARARIVEVFQELHGNDLLAIQTS